MSSRVFNALSSPVSNGHKITHNTSPSFENGSPASTLPDNFAEVMTSIYRSSFPQESNLRALKGLGLKTIVTLVDEPYSLAHRIFLKDGGITHHRILVQANKDPSVKSPASVIAKILEILLTKSNHPVLVHCNKGRHRTGCIIACLRKLQGWSLESVIHEYVRYSQPKIRELDKKFIEEFDVSNLIHLHPSLEPPVWGTLNAPVLAIESDDDDDDTGAGYHSPTWYLQSPFKKVWHGVSVS